MKTAPLPALLALATAYGAKRTSLFALRTSASRTCYSLQQGLLTAYVGFCPNTGRRSAHSRVTATEIALIAGAANTTTGNIAIQATSQDKSQWPTNSIADGEGKLAIPAATKLVSPA